MASQESSQSFSSLLHRILELLRSASIEEKFAGLYLLPRLEEIRRRDSLVTGNSSSTEWNQQTDPYHLVSAYEAMGQAFLPSLLESSVREELYGVVAVRFLAMFLAQVGIDRLERLPILFEAFLSFFGRYRTKEDKEGIREDLDFILTTAFRFGCSEERRYNDEEMSLSIDRSAVRLLDLCLDGNLSIDDCISFRKILELVASSVSPESVFIESLFRKVSEYSTSPTSSSLSPSSSREHRNRDKILLLHLICRFPSPVFLSFCERHILDSEKVEDCLHRWARNALQSIQEGDAEDRRMIFSLFDLFGEIDIVHGHIYLYWLLEEPKAKFFSLLINLAHIEVRMQLEEDEDENHSLPQELADASPETMYPMLFAVFRLLSHGLGPFIDSCEQHLDAETVHSVIGRFHEVALPVVTYLKRRKELGNISDPTPSLTTLVISFFGPFFSVETHLFCDDVDELIPFFLVKGFSPERLEMLLPFFVTYISDPSNCERFLAYHGHRLVMEWVREALSETETMAEGSDSRDNCPILRHLHPHYSSASVLASCLILTQVAHENGSSLKGPNVSSFTDKVLRLFGDYESGQRLPLSPLVLCFATLVSSLLETSSMYRSFCEQYRKEEMILSSLSERVVEIVDEDAERALSKRDARSSILSIFSRFSVLAVDIVQLLLHVDVNSLLIPSFASWEETRSGAIAFLEEFLLVLRKEQVFVDMFRENSVGQTSRLIDILREALSASTCVLIDVEDDVSRVIVEQFLLYLESSVPYVSNFLSGNDSLSRFARQQGWNHLSLVAGFPKDLSSLASAPSANRDEPFSFFSGHS